MMCGRLEFSLSFLDRIDLVRLDRKEYIESDDRLGTTPLLLDLSNQT